MTRRLLQHFRDFRPGGSALVLVLTFLLLPYLVDVAYYGDFTANHFVKKHVNDVEDGEEGEEDLLGVATVAPHLVEDQEPSRVAIGLPPSNVHTSWSHPAEVVLTHECLFIISLTSRPPPVL